MYCPLNASLVLSMRARICFSRVKGVMSAMLKYFETEHHMLSLGQEPTHETQMNWIENMMEKYQDNPAKVIANRNLQMLDATSLVRELNG